MPTGHLGEFTFGTSGITLPVITITPSSESVEDIPEPHLGLAVGSYIPYSPSELVEGGEYTVVLEDDQDTQISVGVEETCTWTKPPAAGNANGATRAFPGYIKEATPSTQDTGERATISVVVKVAGEVTDTPGS